MAPEAETAVGFKTEKGKVHTGEGAIIGQFLFDGEQVKGDVSSSMAEVVTAAERDATDRINRNRIPRQYHKAVRSYFSTVQSSIKDGSIPDSTGSGKQPDTKSEDGSSDKP